MVIPRCETGERPPGKSYENSRKSIRAKSEEVIYKIDRVGKRFQSKTFIYTFTHSWLLGLNVLWKYLSEDIPTQDSVSKYFLHPFGGNKVKGLVLNTKLILFPENWRLFFGNHLFQLLAFVIDWHGAHQGEVCSSGVRAVCTRSQCEMWLSGLGTSMWAWGQMSAYSQQKRSQCRLQTLDGHSTHQLCLLCLLCLTRAAQLSNAPPALTGSLLISAVSELSTYPHLINAVGGKSCCQ